MRHKWWCFSLLTFWIGDRERYALMTRKKPFDPVFDYVMPVCHLFLMFTFNVGSLGESKSPIFP